mmetsp:Transcript_8745/g.8840  ORF Transcript_8745/g.8840 Transcript_8745/m.8840 type:complete len:220 (-) Transcript_8745:83-742(-)
MEHGFNGLLLDIKYSNPTINLHKETITSKNIVSLFQKYKVPIEADYVSIDIDSTDLWVFRAIISSEFRPRVISVEYNINFPIDSNVTCSKDCIAFACRLFGSSLGALNIVANEFGYKIVSVVRNLDVFFVREDILHTVSNINIPSVYFYAQHTGIPYYKDCTFKGIKHGLGPDWGVHYVGNHTIDYVTWLNTNGDWEAAKEAGVEQLKTLKIFKNIAGV